MKALTVVPLARDSARLGEIDEPALAPPETLLVEMICVGVCGTDREIAAVLGISGNAVRQAQSRAVSRLRGLMGISPDTESNRKRHGHD